MGLIPGLIIGVCCGYKLWHSKVQTHPITSNNLPPSPLIPPRFLPPLSEGPMIKLAPTNFPSLPPLPPLNQGSVFLPPIPQYPPILPPITLPPLSNPKLLPALPHLSEPTISRISERKRQKLSSEHHSKTVVAAEKCNSPSEEELNSTDVLCTSELDSEMDIQDFENKYFREQQHAKRIYKINDISESSHFTPPTREACKIDQSDVCDPEQDNIANETDPKMEQCNNTQYNNSIPHYSETSSPTNHHLAGLKKDGKSNDDNSIIPKPGQSPNEELEASQTNADSVSTIQSQGDQNSNVEVPLTDTTWPQTLD